MMKNQWYRLSPAEQAEQTAHLRRLLQAIDNGLTVEDAKQYLELPSGRRVRIRGTRPDTNDSRLILEAAGDDDDGS